MKPVLSALAVLALSALAACDEAPMEMADTAAPMAPDLTSPAAVACRTAIASEVGVSTGDVAIFQTDFSEAGTLVTATVAGAVEPWACLASNSGVVEEVYYTAEG